MYKRTPLEKRLRLRGAVWSFYAYDYRGERYTATTHQTDRKAALEAARKIERERSVPQGDPASHATQSATLADGIAELKFHDARVAAPSNTVTFHADRSGHLRRVFGSDALLVDIGTVAALKRYTDKRLVEEAARSTIFKEHVLFRQILALAKDKGIFAGDPKKITIDGFRKYKDVYKPSREWLEKVEHIEALVAHTSENPDKHRVDRRDDILVYVNTGVRRREITKINPEHVSLRTRQVMVYGTKTEGSLRPMPLNDVMVELFRRRLRSAPAGVPLFVEWGSGNRDLQANWKRARKWLIDRAKTKQDKAELNATLPRSMTFNHLRRTFCSQMRNAGVSLDDCAKLLGHEDRTMVELVYGVTAIDTLHRAVAKLPEMTLPPETLPRHKGLSRRHRQRLRAQTRADEAAAASGKSCPSSEATDTVCDTNPMPERAQTGAS